MSSRQAGDVLRWRYFEAFLKRCGGASMIDCMNMHTAEMWQLAAIRVPDSSVDLPTVLISCISFSHFLPSKPYS